MKLFTLLCDDQTTLILMILVNATKEENEKLCVNAKIKLLRLELDLTTSHSLKTVAKLSSVTSSANNPSDTICGVDANQTFKTEFYHYLSERAAVCSY